jgi:diguanylate cyclase (GGDEF)-like protein
MPAVRAPIEIVEAEPSTVGDAERITQVSDVPRAAVTAERFVLLQLDGVDAGTVVALSDQPSTIGRHTGNQIQLQGGGISRNHARITWQAGGHVLEDLQSANGTFVRGQRVTRVVLCDGDLVQLGPHACFRYTRTDEMHERLLRQMFESSTRDALTGAYNRRHFDERLRTELAHAARHGTELSLVLFDLDHFKRVNDTFGHAVGDDVLRHVAHLTASQLRTEDVFARYGGEEFVVLVRGIGLRDATSVAERIRARIEGHPPAVPGVTATISAGCASLVGCGRPDASSLIALADDRLYVAKRRGRNRVVGA